MNPNRFESAPRALLLTFAASLIAMSGIELVLPSLPLMQEALGLSDSAIVLVMTVYLLPGVVVTIPAGAVADAFGTRRVLVFALTGLGLTGVGLFFARSLSVVLGLRLIQGLCAGAIAPLTIAYIGALTDGLGQLRAQAKRSLLMTVGSATLPALGGLVASAHWSGPFALQALALPVAFALWRVRPLNRPAVRPKFALIPARPDRHVMSVHVLSLIRFVALYAFLTFLPLALARFGFTPLEVGLWLGASAGLGAIVALASSGLAQRVRPSALMQAGLVVAGSGLALMAPGGSPLWLIAGGLVFGTGDGLHGVLQNSFLTRVGEAATRNSTVAVAAMAKNLGKVFGPGLVLLTGGALGHTLVFAGLGLGICLSAALPALLRPYDDAVVGR
jgi:MFS family permease